MLLCLAECEKCRSMPLHCCDCVVLKRLSGEKRWLLFRERDFSPMFLRHRGTVVNLQSKVLDPVSVYCVPRNYKNGGCVNKCGKTRSLFRNTNPASLPLIALVKVDGNGGISITRREFSYRFQLEFRRFFNVLVSTRLCEEKRELTAISMVPTSLSALSKSTVALFQVRNEVSALNEVTKASLCVLTVLVQHYLSHRAGK